MCQFTLIPITTNQYLLLRINALNTGRIQLDLEAKRDVGAIKLCGLLRQVRLD
jgi:hypothetical protein